jgi:hypothetical protein
MSSWDCTVIPFKRHYRVVKRGDFYWPEARFLGLFWLPCGLTDDYRFPLPRGIACNYKSDAERVIHIYHSLTCAGREFRVFYEEASS